MAWPLTVTVTGSSISVPLTKTWEGATGDIFVHVDASGVVQIDEPPPTDFSKCEAYQFK